MPILGILLGPVRWVVLAWLASAPRALFAFARSAWWVLITAALYQAHGLVPAHALYISTAVQDALTLAKFSAPYVRPLIDDMMARWRRSDAQVARACYNHIPWPLSFPLTLLLTINIQWHVAWRIGQPTVASLARLMIECRRPGARELCSLA